VSRSGSGNLTTTGSEIKKSGAALRAYIENNPVKAGVVSQAEDYRWASAHATWRAKLDPPSVGTSADVARKSACATDTILS